MGTILWSPWLGPSLTCSPSSLPQPPPFPANPGGAGRGGGYFSGRPAPPGSQSGLCLRQPEAQSSGRGLGLGPAGGQSLGEGPGQKWHPRGQAGAGARAQSWPFLALSLTRESETGRVKLAGWANAAPPPTSWLSWALGCWKLQGALSGRMSSHHPQCSLPLTSSSTEMWEPHQINVPHPVPTSRVRESFSPRKTVKRRVG